MDELMNFSEALNCIKDGKFVFRRGWHKKGMYISLKNAFPYIQPFLAIRFAKDKCVPWAPSQTDILANDWEIQSVE